MIKFEPKDGAEAFVDRTVERRAKGWTWRKVAKAEGCAYTTINEYLKNNPDIRSRIDAEEGGESIENIRQTLMEVAIEKKDRQILIHLSKAKLKNHEERPQQQDQNGWPAMTPEQAKAVQEILGIKDVPKKP